MKTRVISGICIGALVIVSLALGGWFSYGLCLALSLVGLYELYKAAGIEKSAPAVCGYITAVMYYVLIASGKENFDVLLIVAMLMAVMTVYVVTFPRYTANNVMMAFFGVIYVAFMISYMYKVRAMENGIYIVWLILIASWGNDTFAYFTGVLLGKHKMAPKLSPKKSIEGAVGGVLGAILLGAVYAFVISAKMSEVIAHPVLVFTTASFLGAFISIVGDLVASAIKRDYGIKDYGNIIPGHGGILDRFDSCIFTAPVVYWAVYIVMNGIM